MIEANNKIAVEGGQKPVSYYYSAIKDLNISDKPSSLARIEAILVTNMKYSYSSLLYNYSTLFSKAITEAEKKLYGTRLINPNALCLFEDADNVLKSNLEDPEPIFKKYRSKNSE